MWEEALCCTTLWFPPAKLWVQYSCNWEHILEGSLFHHWMQKCLIVRKSIPLTPKLAIEASIFPKGKPYLSFQKAIVLWKIATAWLDSRNGSSSRQCGSCCCWAAFPGVHPYCWKQVRVLSLHVPWSCCCFVQDPLNFSSVVVSAWCKGCLQSTDEQGPLVSLWIYSFIVLNKRM